MKFKFTNVDNNICDSDVDKYREIGFVVERKIEPQPPNKRLEEKQYLKTLFKEFDTLTELKEFIDLIGYGSYLLYDGLDDCDFEICIYDSYVE